MAGEGSFRSLFSLSKPAEKAVTVHTSRETGPKDYLNEEINAAREAVENLDRAVSGAQSFREKSTKLLEEALRTLGRLEQAVAYREYASELIVIACEIKCAARRGITLVNVYGKYSSMVKIMTIFMRSYIHSKFDKQVEHLRSLFPPAIPGAQLAQTAIAGPAAAATVAVGLATSSAMAPQASNTSVPVLNQPQSNLARGSLSHQAQASSNGAQNHPAGGPLVGTILRPTSHDRVFAMAYVPPTQSAVDYVCIWWSAAQRLVFYSEATQSTTNFQIDKAALNVTALGIDEDGNVWSGHAKGLVRVRPKQKWELMVEDKVFSSAVKVITFDGIGRAWVGDDSGRIKVLCYDSRAGRLDTVASLQRSPALLAKMTGALASTTRGLFGRRHSSKLAGDRQGSAEATQLQATTPGPGGPDSSASSLDGATGHNQPVAIEGPVRCIFLRDGRAWTSGGRSSGWLQMWDATSYEDLDVYDCGNFGPCHAIAPLRWPSSPGAAAGPAAAGATYRNNAPGSTNRRTRSDTANQGLDDGSWRLVTGHENGQLLLWHPAHRNLAPLLRIGEPCSPCRGIAAFEPFHLVVTGHQDGKLHLFLQPATEGGLPPGSDSASPQSFGTVRPRTVVIQAHKSRVERMAFCSNSLVTASMLGTIRLWHAADLAMEAHRQGLLAHAPSYTSLATLNGPGPSSVWTGEILGPYTPAQYSRTSNRHQACGDLSQAPSGVLGPVGSPPANQVSMNLSTAMSQGSLGSVHQQQQGVGTMLAAASAGGPGTHHAMQGSRDSTEVAVSTPSLTPSTQPPQSNSGHSGQGDAAAGAGAAAQPLPSAVAGMAHFQTIEISELSYMKHIGSGAYGSVCLAEWAGCQVAVKELVGLQSGTVSSDDKEYAALMNEVFLLGSLSHPNIVRFLAVCLEPPRIVMQYYPHGSLFDLLHRAQRGSAKAAKELSWGKRLDMLRDVAAGMQYLHSRKPPVIHGDLRSPNLLLDLTIDHDRPRFHVKIADFGLARIATGATGSVAVSKTTNPRWLAPEVIRNSSVGKQADVYSFAIIMWEMLTWQQPYEGMMTVQVMFSTVNANMRPEVPAESQLPGGPGVSLPRYRELMEGCWDPDASKRPTFKQVLDVLQDMQRAEAENARQQRHVTQGAAPAPIGRRSRGTSETDGPVAGAAAIDAPVEGSAANGVGNPGVGGGAGAALSAVVPRRVSGSAISSPFGGTPFAPAAMMIEGEPVRGIPPYGMSPILEEQLSSCGAHSRTSLHPAASPLAAQPIKEERPNAPSISAEDVNAIRADGGDGNTVLVIPGAAGGGRVARRGPEALPAGSAGQGGGVAHPDGPGANTVSSVPASLPESANADTSKSPFIESISAPGGGGMTVLSAFAYLPAAQLGALDAAAPHDTGPSTATTIMPSGGSTQHDVMGLTAGTPVRAGVATTVVPSRVAPGRPGGSDGSGPTVVAASARGRFPAPSRAGMSTTGLGPARGNGTTSQTQPDTLPHRNKTVSPRGTRGLGGSGVAEPRTLAWRIGGASTRSQCSAGGDDGNLVASSPVDRCSPMGAPMTERTACADVIVVEQQGGAHRRSASAVQSHVEDAYRAVSEAAVNGGVASGRRCHRRTPSGDTYLTSSHVGTSGSTPLGRPSHRRTPSGGSVAGASFASPTMSSRNRDAAVAMAVHRELPSPFTSPTAAAGVCSQPRTTSTTAPRSGRASPRLAASSSSDSRAGPRRNTPGTGTSPSTPSGIASPSAASSCQVSRLGAGGTHRQPVSPRSLLPGGAGSTSVGASRSNSILATVSLGSRIPCLASGAAPAVPSRSSTCRSLDDLNMHRRGLSHLALCSTSANASSTAADAPTDKDQPEVVPAAWTEGLRVRHSPDATTELNGDSLECLISVTQARETHGSAGDSEMEHSLPTRELSNNAMGHQSPASSANVVSAAGATWEPPPLLAATAGCCGSPFVAAAYPPFDKTGEDRSTEETAASCEDANV